MTETQGSEAPSDPADSAGRPEPGPSGARRLYREPEEKRLTGVSGGLADWRGLDPTIVRRAVVLLALAKGVGVVAYIVAALVVPERPPNVPRVRRTESALPARAEYPVAIALIVVAALVVVLGPWAWWNLGVAGLMLVGLGIWLLVASQDAQQTSASSTTQSGSRTSMSGEPDAGDTDHLEPGHDDAAGAPVAGATGAGVQAAVRPVGGLSDDVSPGDDAAGARPGDVAPPTSPGGHLAGGDAAPRSGSAAEGGDRLPILAALLIAAGVLALLAVTSVVHLSPARVMAAVLVGLGVLLVVTAWRGRARWLIWLGLPILPLLLLVDVIDVPLHAGAGERLVLIDDRAGLTDEHQLLVGDLTIDLREAPLDGPDVPWSNVATLEASLGAGELTVILPENATAMVKARVRAGEINPVASSRHGREDGLNVRRELVLEGAGDGPRVRLDLRVGAGQIELRRGPDVPSTTTTVPPTTSPATTTTAPTTTMTTSPPEVGLGAIGWQGEVGWEVGRG